jgi:hypothetical protein
LTEEHAGPALAGTVESLGGELYPPHARAAPPEIRERAPHGELGHHRPQIGHGTGQPGAANAVDGDHVARLERHHLMRDRTLGTRAPAAAHDADFDDVARREPIEAVKSRRRPVRRDGVRMGGERGRHQALVPRGWRPGQCEHARVRLLEPAVPLGGSDAAAIEVEFGSLATGERTMLRGCKLGNGAYSVVEHGDTVRNGCHDAN